ncbi:hypothetical protein ACU4GH_37480 [Bradyrhizobium betae]
MISQSCRSEHLAANGFISAETATSGTSIMTETTHHDAAGRNRLLAAALEEMAKFERKENEFRQKDRRERAAELHLPLDPINVQ